MSQKVKSDVLIYKKSSNRQLNLTYWWAVWPLPPKAKLMAAYYERLTTLFWASENYLFHAFAWYKFYTPCREYTRGMTKEKKIGQVGAVLFSAMCIPAVGSWS